jgi:carbamoyl-phosphate synthase large subunit
MMNSNPETVSTDYDTSSRLYFEPLTVEDVLNVLETERPDGIIVQFGGQTPLKLASPIEAYLKANPIKAASGEGYVKIWGTPPSAIDAAEDRDQWYAVLQKLGIRQPPGTTVMNAEEATAAAAELGYPVMVRPSFVLGGRAMEIVYSPSDLGRFVAAAAAVDPTKPVLIDKYLDRADEIDVDALCDSEGGVAIAGIMQHIEQAGVHSGDSACSIPTQTIPEAALATIREWTPAIARALGVVGLLNIQYAVQDGEVFIIEANPRASRTVPFVAKAVGAPLAAHAARLMAGETLADVGFTTEPVLNHVAVKEAVLPFDKFAGADTLLGPEMKSTGEVMGIDKDFGAAYAKAAIAAGSALPSSGTIFISMTDKYKEDVVPVARSLAELGYGIVATSGTAAALRVSSFLEGERGNGERGGGWGGGRTLPHAFSLFHRSHPHTLTRPLLLFSPFFFLPQSGGVPCGTILKIQEGRPNAADMMRNGDIALMLITSTGDEPDVRDGRDLRRLALALKIPAVTTLAGAKATAQALAGMRAGPLKQVPIQDYFPAEK